MAAANAPISEQERGIKRQIMLPWSKSFQMCKSSVFTRLGRSIITASGIFLGVAFLSSVLVQTAVLAGLPPDVSGADESTQARAVWLVSMSLVVATVGIVNAMLMAVTERYKEIGTMKCLGALDLFVVRLFLLESGLLGMLGALTGAIVGGLLMTVVQGIKRGWKVYGDLGPAMVIGGWEISLPVGILLAIVLGGALSVLAALYPAWRAAKMPPAAALRVEI